MSDKVSNGIITATAATFGTLTAMIGYNHFNNNKTSMIKSRFRRCQEIRNSLTDENIPNDHQNRFLEKMGCSDNQLIDYLNKNL